MSKAKVKFIILFVLLCLIMSIFLLKIAGGLGGFGMRADTLGTPLVINREDSVITSSITQVLETKDTVFLVYGYRSIIQAYSLDGKYLYTVSVYNYNNGRTEIAYSKNKDVLYISDKRHNLYAFSGKDFLEFIDKSNSRELYNSLYFGRSTRNYHIEAGSVWYTDGSDSRCIVENATWQMYQGNSLDLALLFLLVLTGFVLCFPDRGMKKRLS